MLSQFEIQLVNATIFGLLVLDVFADFLLVPAYRVHVETSCPEGMSSHISTPFEIPGDIDRALPLDEPDDLRHRGIVPGLHIHIFFEIFWLFSGEEDAMMASTLFSFSENACSSCRRVAPRRLQRHALW